VFYEKYDTCVSYGGLEWGSRNYFEELVTR
jgi:hypothetical protein